MDYSPKIVKIESAFDFMKIAYENIRANIDSGDRGYIQFYRGQSNSEWSVTPSIERRPNGNLSSFEGKLVQEFISKRPDEFQHLISPFNTVAKMQHHGMVTRLLDMTSSPAVSLYFACCNDFDKDGEIYLFRTNREEILSIKELDAIIDFYWGEVNKNKSVFFEKCIRNFRKEQYENIFYFLIANSPMAATTEWISERMRRQNSYFLILPFKAVNSSWVKEREQGEGLWSFVRKHGFEKCFLETNFVNTIEDAKDMLIKFHQDGNRYIVKASSKKEILRQLHSIGVSESTLFPELEYEGKRIVNEYLYLTGQSD